MNDIPNTLAIQVQREDGWRKVTTFPFDPMAEDGRLNSRTDAMRKARIGIQAWRKYHAFLDEALRIAECKHAKWSRPEWIEVHS